MSLSYVHEPERWPRLASVLWEAGEFGLDTEYYTLDGLDPRAMTTWGRCRIHVWSLCVEADGEYHTAVLPVQALESSELRDVLESSLVVKYLHNAPVDTHCFANHGIALAPGALVDTLLWSRARMPERHFSGGYGLKDIARDKLQVDHPVSFKSVMSFPKRKAVVKVKATRACSCGVLGCKKKGKKPTKKDPTPVRHDKTVGQTARLEVSILKKRVAIRLQDIRPTTLPHCCGGVPWPDFSETTGLVCWPCLWDALVEYAGNDALWALRAAKEVLSKEGFAYGHSVPTPEKLPGRPRR